ncbi:hypothetical protein GCM10009616_22030 [Microlunatus lacustris]
MERDPELRGKLAKEGRLWGLAAVCATVGAVTVALTDSVPPGVLAFLVALAVLGPLLRRYEKRRRP